MFNDRSIVTVQSINKLFIYPMQSVRRLKQQGLLNTVEIQTFIVVVLARPLVGRYG